MGRGPRTNKTSKGLDVGHNANCKDEAVQLPSDRLRSPKTQARLKEYIPAQESLPPLRGGKISSTFPTATRKTKWEAFLPPAKELPPQLSEEETDSWVPLSPNLRFPYFKTKTPQEAQFDTRASFAVSKVKPGDNLLTRSTIVKLPSATGVSRRHTKETWRTSVEPCPPLPTRTQPINTHLTMCRLTQV